MGKSMQGYAKRAKYAPTSMLRPTTWMMLKGITPWVTLAVTVPVAFWSPVFAFILFFGGCIFYIICDNWVPKPIFPRKGMEPAINFATDEYGLPVMIPVSTFVRHSLLIGTTGSGKTTTIRTMAESFMKLGGGFCFVDGKADVTDTYKILYEIVRNVDREEDCLVLNFLNPEQSHSFNFLLDGQPDFLAEIMAGLTGDAGGDQAYWQGKAKMLMKTILTQLVYMRDRPELFPEFRINVSAIKKYLILNNLKELFFDERLPFYLSCPTCKNYVAGQYGECKKALMCEVKGNPVKARLSSYLQELGVELQQGASKQKSPAAAEAERQHGFYVQQWGEPLDLLVGTFGKIFNAQYPDIDIRDVVINSRILIVLLPSLSYSPSTLRGLGRIVMNAFKIALTTGLGTDIEGSAEEITTKVKRNRPSVPFMLIADEYGSYAVEGIDTMLAQARSLGMGIMISVQEIASLMKASEIDAKRMLANTNIKFFMKIEDSDTAEYIAKRAGEEMYLTPGASGQGDLIQTVANYDGSYQYQKNARIEARDLTSLNVGEGYVIFGDEVRKYSTRYIPEKNNITELRMMKFVRKTIDVAKEKADEMIQDVKSKIDKIFQGAYMLMKEYGIGIKEDRLFKKYIKALDEYYEDTMEIPIIDYDDLSDVTNFINRLYEANYLKAKDESEVAEIRMVVLQRAKYNAFVDDQFEKIVDDFEFWNFILKPSEEINKYLEDAFRDIKAIEKV